MTESLQTSPPVTPAPATRPLMTGWQQASLSLFWFSTNAHWVAILITLLPKEAERIGGASHKGYTLGLILLMGAAISTIFSPLFGAWSDRVRTRWGRRKPFIVAGTLGNIIGLCALAHFAARPPMLIPYILSFMWIQFFNNLATAPYSALIPDVVPVEQRGSSSGWMGLMMMLGNFVGGTCGILLALLGGPPGAFLALAAIMLLGMLGTVYYVREPEPEPIAPFRWDAYLRGLAQPFRSADFRWVFLTRCLVMMGLFTVEGFMFYFMKDVIAGGHEQFAFRAFNMVVAKTADAATPLFILALLVGAILVSLYAGKLSDRHGRKRLVIISALVQALVAACFIFINRYDIIIPLGFLFGIGFGAYQSVEWALATDVLPSAEDYAKDMGVWNMSITLPQVIAAPIAGMLLDRFQHLGADTHLPNLGYTVIFSLAVVYYLLGTVLVSKVKGVR